MASVSQHIPNYLGCISDQPDELKTPGQVKDALNVFPDVTFGLMKRPALRYLAELDTPLDGEWFDYFRDDPQDGREEYIGKVGENGQVFMWNAIDGSPVEVCYSTTPVFRFPSLSRIDKGDLDCNPSSYPTYLQHTERHQLQFTTVNDFTFIANREKIPTLGPVANDVPSFYEGFVEVRVVAYGRNYTLEFFNEDRSSIGKPNYPSPTSGNNSISADTILDDLKGDIEGLGFTVTKIGNGLYIRRDTAFTIETPEAQLLNVLSPNEEDNESGNISKFTLINDVSQLPLQCKHGFLVKVENSIQNTDDIYLKFRGNFDRDGEGAWEETVRPGLRNTFDDTTMPWQIVREFDDATGDILFVVSPVDWDPRVVGDEQTNPRPSFIAAPDADDNTGTPINKVLFYRNRLTFLSNENVIMSRASDFFNLWIKSALSTSPVDPIDIAVSNTYASYLTDGIVVSTGLILFSEFQQFLLRTENDQLTPDFIKVSTLASYDYNIETKPIQMGTSIGFLSEGGTSSRFYEMTNVFNDAEPDVVEQSKVINRRFPAGLDMIADSRENGLITFAEYDKDYLWCFRYFNTGQNRIQSSWFRWDLIGSVYYHTIIGDRYYVVSEKDGSVYLNVCDLKDRLSAQSLDGQDFDYRVHLDYYNEVPASDISTVKNRKGRVLSSSFPLTIPHFSDKNLVAFSLADDDYRGASVPITADMIDNGTVTLDGDWSVDSLAVGYTYDMQVRLPTFYVQKNEQGAWKSELASSLTVHRLLLSFGSVGLYNTTVERLGKDNYEVEYESTPMDFYEADRIPYLPGKMQYTPIYEKNKNFSVLISSSHPGPATIHSCTWEGDYTSRYYKRG